LNLILKKKYKITIPCCQAKNEKITGMVIIVSLKSI